MKNKNITILLAAFALSSCCSWGTSQVEHFDEVDTTPAFVPAVVEQQQRPVSQPEMVELGSIHFDFNSSKLNSDSRMALRDSIIPQAQNSRKVMIEAHCDERGSDAYNMKLSQRRANVVKNYLVKNGVDKNKVKAIGYGESRPLDFRHNEAAWAKNRRATISVLQE